MFGPPGSGAWLPFPVREVPARPVDRLDYRGWIGLDEESEAGLGGAGRG